LPWQVITVAGPSMVPTLRSGDTLLVRRGASVRSGDLVLAQFGELADRLVIKRADHPVGPDWYVRSDNEFAGGDSAVHGPAEVLGRALWRWPVDARGLRRLLPVRIARQPRGSVERGSV
jgi:phage repressor protein C with HTH and peptisase S24 domain